MYELEEEVAAVEDFMRLRRVTGLKARPRDAVIRGLPNSLHGVRIRFDHSVVAMGRVIGDGGLNYEIVDVAVDPAHQGKGLGRRVIQHLVTWLEREAPKGAQVNLIGNVPEIYQKFGFSLTRPKSEGMHRYV